MNRFEGSVAIVTGGAMGMGFATATRLVEEGATVVIADVRPAEGRAAAEALGAAASFIELDVADEASWSALVDEVVARHGGIDVLVNNAGVWSTAPIDELDVAEFDRVIAINQRGVFLGMRAVVAPMRARGGGAIVNLSSSAGLLGYARMVAYCASKWAVRGMTKAAALDLAASKIRVNSVHPGAVATPMTADHGLQLGDGLTPGIPLRRVAAPEEIAAVVAFLCSSDASYVTGAEVAIDGGGTLGVDRSTLQER